MNIKVCTTWHPVSQMTPHAADVLSLRFSLYLSHTKYSVDCHLRMHMRRTRLCLSRRSRVLLTSCATAVGSHSMWHVLAELHLSTHAEAPLRTSVTTNQYDSYVTLYADQAVMFTQRRSVARSVGCFQQRLFVCMFMGLFVNTITSERVNVGWWNLGGSRCIVQKISAEFEFWGHSPPACALTPKNVALGYDVGKISAGCLVVQWILWQNGQVAQACGVYSDVHMWPRVNS